MFEISTLPCSTRNEIFFKVKSIPPFFNIVLRRSVNYHHHCRDPKTSWSAYSLTMDLFSDWQSIPQRTTIEYKLYVRTTRAQLHRYQKPMIRRQPTCSHKHKHMFTITPAAARSSRTYDSRSKIEIKYF